MSDNRTPLAELPNDHLLLEAKKYRAMAATATSPADRDGLERVATCLERMVEKRKLNASAASDSGNPAIIHGSLAEANCANFGSKPRQGLASEPAGHMSRFWPARGKHGHDFDPGQMHADCASAWSAAW